MAWNERERNAWMNAFRQIRDTIGVEEYRKLVVKVAETFEEQLRQEDPDNLALKILDEYRERQRLGLEP